MKRTLISLIVAISLLCALTAGVSANFADVVTGETISEAAKESRDGRITIAVVQNPNTESGSGELKKRVASGNFNVAAPSSTPTPIPKKASQIAGAGVKSQKESAPQTVTNAESASGFFTDVPQESYYFDAVRWAVEQGITNGTTAATFSPANTCTRAQVVTFFWRNAGQPEPSSQTNPFSDVPEGSYYEKAVLWAVEKGITNGTSATTFSPNQPCSYAHVVTFLWRLNNPGEDNRGEGAWYTAPAAWANSAGLLTGTNFIPNEPCPRSDIVTYLYRDRHYMNISMSIGQEGYLFSAVITRLDPNGLPIWEHKTGGYAEPYIFEIGTFGDQYLYVESESLVALDVNTGAVRWKNDDFQGYPISASGYAMGTNGVLYLFGFEAPAFFGIDMNGNTVGKIEDFYNNPDYLIPTKNIQRVDENHMSVEVYSDDGEAFLVDLRDFSYEGPFDENDSRVAPRIGPFLSGAWMKTEENVSLVDVEQIGDLYLFNVSWKGGHRWSFSGKWENGVIRYTNGFYSHRGSEFEWGQTGTIRLSGDTLIWTSEEGTGSEPIEYVRWYEAPTED